MMKWAQISIKYESFFQSQIDFIPFSSLSYTTSMSVVNDAIYLPTYQILMASLVTKMLFEKH